MEFKIKNKSCLKIMSKSRLKNMDSFYFSQAMYNNTAMSVLLWYTATKIHCNSFYIFVQNKSASILTTNARTARGWWWCRSTSRGQSDLKFPPILLLIPLPPQKWAVGIATNGCVRVRVCRERGLGGHQSGVGGSKHSYSTNTADEERIYDRYRWEPL